MAKVSMKAVLRELQRRVDVRFGDNEMIKNELEKALDGWQKTIWENFVHSQEAKRVSTLLKKLKTENPKLYDYLNTIILNAGEKMILLDRYIKTNIGRFKKDLRNWN